MSDRIVLLSRFRDSDDARVLSNLWDELSLEVRFPQDSTWRALREDPPRAIVVGAEGTEAASGWYRAARAACPDVFVVVATDDIILTLGELLYAGHDRKLGFLRRPFNAGVLRNILSVDVVRDRPARARQRATVDDAIAEHARAAHAAAAGAVGGQCERVGDAVEVRARIEEPVLGSLRATLRVDLKSDAVELDAALPPGRPLGRLVPERGLRRLLKFALDDLVVGDEAVDAAYLIDAEAEDREAIRALAGPLIALAPARARVDLKPERLVVTVGDEDAQTAGALWTLWTLIVDIRRGRSL